MSFCTSLSLNFLPTSLFTANNVLFGFVTACLLAGCPTRTWSSEVYATTDGVVLLPSELEITSGASPSITATHELVVPKSIPMIFPILFPY